MIKTKVNNSLKVKLDSLRGVMGDTVSEKVASIASYGAVISPVDTGAYVKSMSIRPKGSSGGRSVSSEGRPSLPSGQKEAVKQSSVGVLKSDAETYSDQIIDSGGAVISNRSPHALEVEKKYEVFGRMKDRFR